jgi:hypothetical protein
MFDSESIIHVRRQWNDYRNASYKLADIDGLHWTAYSGGVRQRAPREFLHGYVRCDAMLSGMVAHSGLHGPCPHRIKVCIVKSANPSTFAHLLELCPPPEKPSQGIQG